MPLRSLRWSVCSSPRCPRRLLAQAAGRTAPAPAVTVAPVLAARHRRVGRVQRPARGGGPGRDPAPRVGLHQAGHVHRRAAKSGRARCSSRSTPGPIRPISTRAQAQLEQARTAADLAAREVARAEKLVDVQAISREEFDSRTSAQANGVAAVQAAEAAVETARLNLGWTQVRSPIAGRVSRAEVTEGNLVQAGPPDATLLTTVVSLDSDLPLLRQRRADLSALLRARGRRRATELARRALPGLPRAGQRDRLPPRRPARLRGQPDRPAPAGPSAPARSSPTVTAGSRRACSPGSSWWAASARRRCWCATRPSAPTRTGSSCWCSARATASSIARSSSAGCRTTASASCARASQAGDKVVVNGLMRVRPGMKVTPTVVAMVPDSSDSHRARSARPCDSPASSSTGRSSRPCSRS